MNSAKKNLLLLVCVLLLVGIFSSNQSYAQGGISVNTTGTNPDNSAMLDVQSTTKGILIPRMTEAQRTTIASPATGLMVYQTDNTTGFYYYNGSAWASIGAGSFTETDPKVATTTTGRLARWNGTSLADGLLFDNGTNVGLGTTSPTAKFHVYNGDGRLDRGANTAGVGRVFTINGARSGQGSNFAQLNFENYDNNDGLVDYVGATIGSQNTGNVDAGDLRFSTYNGTLTERMIISKDGNVGVGTSSPTSRLHVANNGVNPSVLIGSGSSQYPYALSIAPTTHATSRRAEMRIDDWSILQDITGAGTKDFAIYQNSITSYRFSISSTGNVGIGTTLPTQRLDVIGTTRTTNLQMTSGATNGFVLRSDASGNASWVNPTSLAVTESDPKVGTLTTNYLPKWNGTTLADGLLFDDGTNVGIGTASPADKLHVVGNARIDAGRIDFRNTGSSVFIGTNAGLNDDLTSNVNVFVGESAGQAVTTGQSNVAVGINAMKSNTSVGYNTAVGWGAMENTTGANNSTAMGHWSLRSNTSGSNNIALGSFTLRDNLSGSNNVAVGMNAGLANLGSGNLFLGNAAGQNETGSNKLYIDNSNTASPLIFGDFGTNLLRVNGTLNVNNAYSLPTSDGTANQYLQTNGAGTTSWVTPSFSITESDPKVGTLTINYLPKWNGTTLANGLLFDNGTNVGLGTTSPTAKFHVYNGDGRLDRGANTAGVGRVFTINGARSGQGSNFAQLNFENYDNNDGLVDYVGATIGSQNTGSVDAGDLRFSTYNGTLTERMIISKDGNVGVGISSPTSRLHVANNGVNPSVLIESGSSQYPYALSIAPTTHTTSRRAEMRIDDWSILQDITGSGTKNFAIYQNSLTSHRFSISSTGNVGIGVSSATQKLDVAGTTRTTNFQMTSGATNGYILQSDATGNASWVNANTLTITESDPKVGTLTTNYLPKWNGTSLADGLLFDDGTNVGIGTTSPADKLHVVGNMRIDAGRLDFRNTGNSVFIGENAGLNDDLTNNENVYIGYNAGNLSTTSGSNVALGSGALSSNTTAAGQTAIGFGALASATTGFGRNTAVGRRSLNVLTTGFGNVAVGESALIASTTGSNNVGIGVAALGNNTTGIFNVAVGYQAGLNNLTGTGNVFLGYQAGSNEINSDKLYIDNSNTSSPLIYGEFDNKYLEINGSLRVKDTKSYTIAYGYLNSAGNTGTSSGTNAYSIYASARIAATEFNAYSDARIKKIKGITNNANDLATLAKIRITDYTHIDSISKGNKEVKKVIAQELKTVYPQAVSMMTDVVPDIYQQASIENGFITLPTNLKVGEKVKIIFATGEEVLEVTGVGVTGFRVNSDKAGKVFVFGRQVDDFHVVDYEALSTLNISATQALLKKIEMLENKVQNLETENKKIKALEAKMQNIEKMLQQTLPAEAKK